MQQRLFTSFCIGAILILSLFNTSNVSANNTLILGVHPYLQHDEVRKRFTPLANYLSKTLDMQVNVRIGQNYQAHLNAIGENKIDIAYLGPVVYVKMVEQFGARPLLARLESDGKPTFQGHIIVAKNSPYKELKDLKGQVFAFGDPNSTMSSLVPEAMLKLQGIYLDDLAGYANYKGHTNVAYTVLSGDADAGAVKEEVFHKMKSKGLRSLIKTPAISEHLFVTRSDMSKDLIAKIRNILLNINSKELVGLLLKPIKKTATGLVSVEDSDYINLRKLLDALRE